MSSDHNTPCVVTLVARKGAATLTEAAIHAAAEHLETRSERRWLAPSEAVDLAFEAAPGALAPLRARMRAWAQQAGLDVFVQPQAHRRKRLLLADMDSTLIGQECIDELAAFVGLKERVAAITERAMRGEIAFEPALRERVALLGGLPVSVVETVLAERITLTPGARAVVATMRAHGAYCALVSGGFTLFTAAIAALLGFDEHRGNTLLVEGDRFSGAVAEPILGRDAKRAALVELRDRLGLDPAETLAVGDGANDLAMLGEAGFGVAFRAKPAVAAAADACIERGDLGALLYAQGFPASAFLGA